MPTKPVTTSRHHGRRALRSATTTLAVLLTFTLAGVTAQQAGATDGAATASSSSTPTTAPTKPRPNPLDTVLVKRGDTIVMVRGVKARLVQLKLMSLPFDGRYGPRAVAGVKKFQKKHGFKVTGKVDRRTWNKLKKVTRTPTATEKSGQLPKPPRVPGSWTTRLGKLDSRCLTGMALCIDKTTRTLQWVVDGTPRLGLDVRFGGRSTPTREGQFTVYRKSRDHVSSIYHTPMPYAMFFSGGQAVHYSPDFAARGYGGASHGCVNVRDRNALADLFDRIPIGTRVVVYWS